MKYGTQIFTIAPERTCVILETHRDFRRVSLTDKYSISVDRPGRLIRLRVWGFWSEGEARDYYHELSEAMGELAETGPWKVLADVRMFPIQSSPVQTIHTKLMRKALQMGMVKAANIVGGRLTRIQIEELAESAWPEKGYFDYFTSLEEAENWLEDRGNEFSAAGDERFLQAF